MSGLIPMSTQPTFMWAVQMFFALIIAHSFGDYAFQPPFIALHKNRHTPPVDPPGGHVISPHLWIHCLNAHVLIHAGLVWWVSGVFALAIAETVLHWVIDFSKCEGWLTFEQDQICHLSCKLLYVVALYLFPAIIA